MHRDPSRSSIVRQCSGIYGSGRFFNAKVNPGAPDRNYRFFTFSKLCCISLGIGSLRPGFSSRDGYGSVSASFGTSSTKRCCRNGSVIRYGRVYRSSSPTDTAGVSSAGMIGWSSSAFFRKDPFLSHRTGSSVPVMAGSAPSDAGIARAGSSSGRSLERLLRDIPVLAVGVSTASSCPISSPASRRAGPRMARLFVLPGVGQWHLGALKRRIVGFMPGCLTGPVVVRTPQVPADRHEFST